MKKTITDKQRGEIIDYLKKRKKMFVNKNILKSEILVIDGVLKKKYLAGDFFDEIYMKLSKKQWQVLISETISLAAFWNPEKIKKMLDKKNELLVINNEISLLSKKLSVLIKKRSDIAETSGLHVFDCYHIIELIHRAGVENNEFLFDSEVKDKLLKLRGEFDLKYWPKVEDIVREISKDAGNTKVDAIDSISVVVMSTNKASKAAFLRGFYKTLKELSDSYSEIVLLPSSFSLSDKAIASMVNSVLQLDEKEMADAHYVKRFRQGLRETVVFQ